MAIVKKKLRTGQFRGPKTDALCILHGREGGLMWAPRQVTGDPVSSRDSSLASILSDVCTGYVEGLREPNLLGDEGNSNLESTPSPDIVQTCLIAQIIHKSLHCKFR
jgi:hypothetical protein